MAPKSALSKAQHYLREQWPYLIRYLEDGRLELSNNRAERSIKPFVIGRKNFLFANSPLGAQSSAVIYSLIETAKESGLDIWCGCWSRPQDWQWKAGAIAGWHKWFRQTLRPAAEYTKAQLNRGRKQAGSLLEQGLFSFISVEKIAFLPKCWRLLPQTFSLLFCLRRWLSWR